MIKLALHVGQGKGKTWIIMGIGSIDGSVNGGLCFDNECSAHLLTGRLLHEGLSIVTFYVLAV